MIAEKSEPFVPFTVACGQIKHQEGVQCDDHARRFCLHLPLPRESIPSTISMSVCACIKLIILWHASSRQGKEYLNVIRCMICLILLSTYAIRCIATNPVKGAL